MLMLVGAVVSLHDYAGHVWRPDSMAESGTQAGVIAFGRPPLRPRSRALAKPAIALSRDTSASSCAKAAIIVMRTAPMGVDVSRDSDNERNATPRMESWWSSSKVCFVDLPRRSRRQALSTPPRGGRRDMRRAGAVTHGLPLTPWSSNTLSAPATVRASL